MSDSKAKATLSRGRQSWCVIFRHPVCMGPDGKQKLRVRRGLGTPEKEQAQALVDQLNEILSDPTLWNLSSREAVSKNYDEKIVAAFYDPMLPAAFDPWSIREEVIPLPGGKDPSDGYARVLFVGTTGSGKTTIVRQLLGTDPERERFPSISAAKTTICDIEIVLDEGPLRAVVTFIPRDRVRQYISECVLSATVTKLEGGPERDVIRRFLEHSEQRFRLSYILGNPTLLERSVNDDIEDEDDFEGSGPDPAEHQEISEKEREELLNALKTYFHLIDQLHEKARSAMNRMAGELGIKIGEATKEDRDVLQELVEDHLANMDEFHQLVDAILDDIESRFNFMSDGEIYRGKDGWPIKWIHQDPDRSAFIKVVNRFSSNYAPNFGRLLTPLVEGIRVAGPFRPEWNNNALPKIVIMDGQGIGHTADSTSSLSTSITSRFRMADAIVLVDNAAQPMQAGPCAVLQSLVISGHESKLLLAFTHFDEVKGDNLKGSFAKKDHVIGSFDNAVHAIGKSFGREAESALRNLIPEHLFFLANIQKRLPESAKFTLSEMQRFMAEIESSIVPAGPIEYKPVYDVANLVLAIQKASKEFHERWRGILGMGSVSGIRPEHWTRVKALSRRLGIFKVDEYDTLMPVADLIKLLQLHLSQFLSSPLGWMPSTPPQDSQDRIDAVDTIKKEVFTRLHDLSRRRVLDERVREWVSAYEHRGVGSTQVRARGVATIYEEAAPIPNEMPGPDSNKFLFELRELIAGSVKSAGGQLKGWTE
ncbi:MAG: hypothetical protein GXY80_15270 [Syntrophorhabdus aromaticivorans]|uniref:AAA+ ATPase domain-containing protein n=1 Tax=Syntrophorhabdus aromaticivorans TaxID=328301 RepID=A0A971M7S8_9BACT|nr:hypothetical protein [Syntrophorhabdus aromaticivorans]